MDEAERSMRVAITGSSGLIGTALWHALVQEGSEVTLLVRHPPKRQNEVLCDFSAPEKLVEHLDGQDALIHLAGHNVANRIRWNDAEKSLIRRSRIDSTHALVQALSLCQAPPKTFLCASAIGIYGTSCEEALQEDIEVSARGFLAEVCRDWESAARSAKIPMLRIAHLRFGIVLCYQGGALKRMLPIFRFGLGSPLGSGSQWMSWISLPDCVAAILRTLHQSSISGPVNIVSPQSLTNRDFSKTLAKALKRPLLPAVPSFVLTTFLGEFARETILSSTKAYPFVLERSGYRFRHPTLDLCLKELLAEEKLSKR